MGKQNPTIHKNPFFSIIWVLKQCGLSRDIVRLICENYVTVACEFRFRCPYVQTNDGDIYHLHCAQKKDMMPPVNIMQQLSGTIKFRKNPF